MLGMCAFTVCTFNLDTVTRDLILVGLVSNFESVLLIYQLDKTLTNLRIIEVTFLYRLCWRSDLWIWQGLNVVSSTGLKLELHVKMLYACFCFYILFICVVI